MTGRAIDSRMAEYAAPVLPSQAAAGAPTTPPTPGGGTHTLHIEQSWRGSYRIIHTKPGGEREVWRRDIATLDEARHRCRIVEEMLGYEARL